MFSNGYGYKSVLFCYLVFKLVGFGVYEAFNSKKLSI
jgi:hypothetical protein